MPARCTCPPDVYGDRGAAQTVHVEVVTCRWTLWKRGPYDPKGWTRIDMVAPAAEGWKPSGLAPTTLLPEGLTWNLPPRRYAFTGQLVATVAEGHCILADVHAGRRHRELVSAFDYEQGTGVSPEGDRWGWCPECHIYQRVVSPRPVPD